VGTVSRSGWCPIRPARAPIARTSRGPARRLLTAAALAAGTILGLSLAGAAPAFADSPTPPPLQNGRHVYDFGDVFSSRTTATAEALAAHIESLGAGRVAIYTAGRNDSMPDRTRLAADWQTDGMLITGSGVFGTITYGSTLGSRLTPDEKDAVDSSPGMSTLESWILSSLARIDGLLSGSHVFDGAGILDAAARQKAEAAAQSLGDKLGAEVYVDIALGHDDPSSVAFFNGAGLSRNLGTKALVIALGVSDSQVGGYIDTTGDLFSAYHTTAPWTSSTLENQATSDVPGTVLELIDDVQGGSGYDIGGDMLPVIVFVVVIVLFSITAPFLWGPWLIRKMTGVSGPIKGGVPSDAIIQSITDTGVTVSMASVGPDAPEYKLGLAVTPIGGGATYMVEAKALVPRIYLPMVVPGAHVGVLIDPTNPQHVSVDFSRMSQPGYGMAGAGAAAGFAGAAGFGGSPSPYGQFGPAGAAAAGSAPNMDLSFDAAGNPNMAQLGAFASAVSQGQMPTHTGSAAQLLATGTHGTAVITTAMPLGKTVRQINPSADPSTLDDPLWMFTVEVSLAGQTPFPAVFGHRVPKDKTASIGPGTKLAVAVNPANKNQEVAIDWNQSPLAS
jgi:hypothetical protein